MLFEDDMRGVRLNSPAKWTTDRLPWPEGTDAERRRDTSTRLPRMLWQLRYVLTSSPGHTVSLSEVFEDW